MYLFRRNIDLTKKPSLVLVGDGGTGKSSLFERMTCPDKKQYKFNKSYKATEGFNLKEIVFDTNVGQVHVHVWDTAGQEKFGNLRSAYVHSADMCIVMYDAVEPKTKDNIRYWLNYLKKHCQSSPVVAVCGNKKDKIKNANLLNTVHLRQTVLEKNYNYANDICNMLISVKNNENIKQTIEWVLSKHYGRTVKLV